jgi:hypothetical protein
MGDDEVIGLSKGLGKLEVKIDYIVKTVDELKECQTALNTCVTTLKVDIASRPSKEKLEKALDKVQTHDTYFVLIGGALVLFVMWVSGWLGDVVRLFISRL